MYGAFKICNFFSKNMVIMITAVFQVLIRLAFRILKAG
ncbi:hypothetical protein PU02_0235 [Bartonella ancashensis]|uniref:Uncharacterized protein n=1 Tax=Bartonella ancashensis TaxID=1318743 RepID=A0A0M4M2F6_9HYPH|nr:hypothetical protein PU02_0235 [Bartonella ancashensis]